MPDPIGSRGVSRICDYFHDEQELILESYRNYMADTYRVVCPDEPDVQEIRLVVTKYVLSDEMKRWLSAIVIAAALKVAGNAFLSAMALLALHMNATVDSQMRIVDYESKEPPHGNAITLLMPGR